MVAQQISIFFSAMWLARAVGLLLREYAASNEFFVYSITTTLPIPTYTLKNYPLHERSSLKLKINLKQRRPTMCE